MRRGHLLQGLLAQRTAEVVVQTPLHTVLAEGVAAGGGDWLVEQPEVHIELTMVQTQLSKCMDC